MSHCYIRSDDSHLAFWMFWSKMNCEKLALYIYIYVMYIFCPQLDTRYIFQVWHFANVKSTDTAIGLLNFEERGQRGFLSMIMDVGMMWWLIRHLITKIRIFARISHMFLRNNESLFEYYEHSFWFQFFWYCLIQVEFPEARIFEEDLNVLLYENRTGPDDDLMQATRKGTVTGHGYHSDDDADEKLDREVRMRRK